MLLIKQLVAPTLLTGTNATYYTAPATATGQAAVTAKISRAVFVNTDSSAHTITVSIVAPGGTAATGNTLINAISISAGQTYISPELAGCVLPAGTTIQGLASSASLVIIMISGLTIQ